MHAYSNRMSFTYGFDRYDSLVIQDIIYQKM